MTPEPENYPEETARMEEPTEGPTKAPTPQTPELMETQTPRVKRTIEDVVHSPTEETSTNKKKTRINLNINLKNRLL